MSKKKTESGGGEGVRIIFTLNRTLNIHWRAPKVKLRQRRMQVWNQHGSQGRGGENNPGVMALSENAKAETPERKTRVEILRRAGR